MERVLEPEYMDTPEEADGYDAMDHTDANTAFVERLMELGAHGKILDIGTGPGHIPLMLAERVPDGEIIGIDMASHMLAHAERHLAASQLAEAMPPDRQKAQPTMTVRAPCPEMRPYAEHADEMTLTDWWAIALGESTEVTLEFDVPAENLKIRMRGNPREFGPATLQVRTNEGQLIRQFEQQQISVEQLNPDAEQKDEGAAPCEHTMSERGGKG